jgi:hypothetical protein
MPVYRNHTHSGGIVNAQESGETKIAAYPYCINWLTMLLINLVNYMASIYTPDNGEE